MPRENFTVELSLRQLKPKDYLSLPISQTQKPQYWFDFLIRLAFPISQIRIQMLTLVVSPFDSTLR